MIEHSKIPSRDAGRALRVTRRDALGAVGAALALSGLFSCSRNRQIETRDDWASRHPYNIPIDTQVQLAARIYGASVLEKALAITVKNRISRRSDLPSPVVAYNKLIVYDRPEEDGGGLSFGQDFPRALLTLGLGRCDRIFEMCAGPGYIGYSLLANGFCQKLTLADINPRAVQSARQTALVNGISELVNIYVSDNLKQIPDVEKWDLVVGNPPHFGQAKPHLTLILDDPGWSMHHDFYLSVRRFMKPGGHIVLVESEGGSVVSDFEPMIRQGGGTLVASSRAVSLTGKPFGFYYVVSKW
jgi:hypothetical protein